jgi:eukaryotic-like serine/threonine-protein kinase
VSDAPSPAPSAVRILGRYALYDEIASGGMATVHIGRLLGPVGFSRTVAIKKLHPQYAKEPQFVSMFMDEARLAARIRHPNVLGTLDVVVLAGELFLVMDYVEGESVQRLAHAAKQRGERVPVPIAGAILVGALDGLHAAHEATSEQGEPLGLIHRDVSPQNILVGTDGVPRILDFGVAKAVGRVEDTKDGVLKGKLRYMAPEQVNGETSRATDIYAASVVLWELLTGHRLVRANNDMQTLANVTAGNRTPPSAFAPYVTTELDAIVLRGMKKNPEDRFSTAREMARAIQRAIPIASANVVGEWVERMAGATIRSRTQKIASMEGRSGVLTLIPESSRELTSGTAYATAPVQTALRPRSRPVLIALLVAATLGIGALVGLRLAASGMSSASPSVPAAAISVRNDPSNDRSGGANGASAAGSLWAHEAAPAAPATSEAARTDAADAGAEPPHPHHSSPPQKSDFSHVMDSRK